MTRAHICGTMDAQVKGAVVRDKQMSFADIEYGNRKRKTRRKAFLDCMDEIILWNDFIVLIEPYY